MKSEDIVTVGDLIKFLQPCKEQAMKVYSVLLSVQYEGESLLGVFGSREEAIEFAKSQEGYQKGWYGDFGIVESELGQPIDFHRMVDWVHYMG